MRNRSFVCSGLAVSTAAVALLLSMSAGSASASVQTNATAAATTMAATQSATTMAATQAATMMAATQAATMMATTQAATMTSASATMAATMAMAAPAGTAAVAATSAPTATPVSDALSGSGVSQVHGTVKITNQFQLGDTAEPMIALIDLTAFIKRNHDLHLPYADQVIAGVYTDPITGVTDLSSGAEYTMQLPIEPRGMVNDVAHGKGGSGVMTFAVDFDTNAVGDSFMGHYEWTGWPGGADGLEFDPGTYEVAQGKFLVWSPDDKQMFPTGFGADGKLFTADDPIGPIGKGWTVVTVDADHSKPFSFSRDMHSEVPILEGLSANNDLSNLSYTAAFDELVKELKLRYTYTDFKHLNWDTMVAAIRPLVETAEKDKSTEEFNIAILKFELLFHDGHVGGSTPAAYFAKQTSGGLGMVLGQTDDGTVIVTQVLPTLPADKAGIKVGAVITQWNGQPVAKAVAATPLEFVTESSPIPTLLQQLRYITRSPVGTKFSLEVQNPDDSAAKAVDLVSVKESASSKASSFYKGTSPADMPITYKVIQTGGKTYGYIKINTFESDSVLMTRTWEQAINTFNQLQIPALIVDVRQNGGGSGLLATYFAGSFTSTSFELNESYQADKNGTFVYTGKTMIDPAPAQWTSPVAIMVGPACASACEIFSAAVAHDPNHQVVSKYPSAGIEASVEAWTLPDNLYFQAPTGRLIDPVTKGPFLEGVGVQPTVKVPVTKETLLSSDDVELAAAEATLDKAVQNAAGQ